MIILSNIHDMIHVIHTWFFYILGSALPGGNSGSEVLNLTPCTSTPRSGHRLFRPWEELTPIKSRHPRAARPPLCSGTKVGLPRQPASASALQTPQKTRSTSPSPGTLCTEPSLFLAVHHPAFIQEIHCLQYRFPSDAWLFSLMTSYLGEAQQLEALRCQALITHAANTAFLATVHRYYDNERVVLLTQATISLEGFKTSKEVLVPSPTPSPPAHVPMTSTPVPADSPWSALSCSDSGYSYSSSGSSSTSRGSSPTFNTQPRIPIGKRQLNSHAIQLMEDWFSHNVSHPYANSTAMEELATAGSVTVSQVRKWLANKRMRATSGALYRSDSASGALYRSDSALPKRSVPRKLPKRLSVN